jgi:hypothetical protein
MSLLCVVQSSHILCYNHGAADATAELLQAIEQADKDCGSCGCDFDPLYKKVLKLLKTV